MRQKFYENTIQSKFIKALLSNFYIPIVTTIKPGDYLIKGITYATNNSLIRCIKSGIYRYEPVGTETEEELGLKQATTEYIQDFVLGRYYPKFTEHYVPKTDYYDTATHEWLGKVLRVFSDLKGIDLMAYYNMFSDNYVPNIRITENDVSSYVWNAVKTIKIPIKFNRKYTIAIDCPSSVWIAPAFLAKDNFLIFKNPDGSQEVVNQTFLTKYADKQYVKNYSNTSFKQPFTYEVHCEDFDYVQYERDLYMLIQLPASNKSSIVVLEGDYTSLNKEVTLNFEYSDYFSNHNLNNVLKSNLSLLQFNNKESYPFADRLIEYLLDNVITKDETLKKNITTVQDSLVGGFLTDQYVRGVWNEYTRARVYQRAMDSNKVTKLDLTGYVDKDTERLFGDR